MQKIIQDPDDPFRYIVVEDNEEEPQMYLEAEDDKNYDYHVQMLKDLGMDERIQPREAPRQEFTREYLKKNIHRGKLRYDLSRFKAIGDFDCSGLNLTSLVGVPHHIEGNFNCRNNNIETLEGAPVYSREFQCSDNPIRTLEHLDDGQVRIYYYFVCHYTRILTFKGLKNTKIMEINIGNNHHVISYEGIPAGIGPGHLKVSADFNSNLNSQLSWYAYKGNQGYEDYWQEMMDYFLSIEAYNSIDHIYWHNDVYTTEIRNLVKEKLYNIKESKKAIQKFKL